MNGRFRRRLAGPRLRFSREGPANQWGPRNRRGEEAYLRDSALSGAFEFAARTAPPAKYASSSLFAAAAEDRRSSRVDFSPPAGLGCGRNPAQESRRSYLARFLLSRLPLYRKASRKLLFPEPLRPTKIVNGPNR